MARLLLDENLPRALATLFVGHSARTVVQMRWGGLRNGTLLDRAESEFDVLVTMDASMRFQQSMVGRQVALLVLRPRSNNIEDLEPLVPQALLALRDIRPGQIVVVEGPERTSQ